MNKTHLISIVIPSLGGDLCETLEGINSGSVYPDEIIVCLPNDTHSIKDANKYENLTVIYAERYGQVYQRIMGFKQSKNDWVLQIDDDIALKENTLEKLIKCSISLGEKSAVSPAFLEKTTGISLYKDSPMIRRMFYWIVNGKDGFQPGVVNLVGMNSALFFEDNEHNVNESEWLPGGCVLHRKKNLILEDYFPFKGKAYAEDIIHSFLLRQQGVKLYVCKDAMTYVDVEDGVVSWAEFVGKYRAAKYVSILHGRSQIRFSVYYLIRLIIFLVKWIRCKVSFNT